MILTSKMKIVMIFFTFLFFSVVSSVTVLSLRSTTDCLFGIIDEIPITREQIDFPLHSELIDENDKLIDICEAAVVEPAMFGFSDVLVVRKCVNYSGHTVRIYTGCTLWRDLELEAFGSIFSRFQKVTYKDIPVISSVIINR